jgi:hypothetical protein
MTKTIEIMEMRLISRLRRSLNRKQIEAPWSREADQAIASPFE